MHRTPSPCISVQCAGSRADSRQLPGSLAGAVRNTSCTPSRSSLLLVPAISAVAC